MVVLIFKLPLPYWLGRIRPVSSDAIMAIRSTRRRFSPKLSSAVHWSSLRLFRPPDAECPYYDGVVDKGTDNEHQRSRCGSRGFVPDDYDDERAPNDIAD
jgi:hypothetical protein